MCLMQVNPNKELCLLTLVSAYEKFNVWTYVACFVGADTVRFKAEVNFDGREITKRHLSRKDLPELVKVNICLFCFFYYWLRGQIIEFTVILKNTISFLQEIKHLHTPEELERFMLDHGEQIIDTLGQEVDRIERNIKVGFYTCFVSYL